MEPISPKLLPQCWHDFFSLRVKTSHQFASQNQPVLGMVLGGFFGFVGDWTRFAGSAGFGFLGR